MNREAGKKNRPLTVRRLTPAGRGAVASIRLSGSGAFSFFAQLFSTPSGRPLSSTPETWKNRLLFGFFSLATDGKNDDFSSEFTPSREQVVVAILSPDEIEIDCHGGEAVSAAILRTLANRGAAQVEPFDSFDPLALDGGDSENVPANSPAFFSPPGWEAVAEKNVEFRLSEPFVKTAARLLPQTKTERGVEIVLDQLAGASDRLCRAVAESTNAYPLLDRAIAAAPLGRYLTRSARVVFLGPVNAGKSSLVNAILGFDRVITDSSAGTTRDLVTAETVLDGIPLLLTDTAGIRPSVAASGAIERAGMSLAIRAARDADLILAVFVATKDGQNKEKTPSDIYRFLAEAGENRPDSEFTVILESKPILTVFTKTDLLPTGGNDGRRKSPWDRETNVVRTSLADSDSIDRLKRKIVAALIPEFPPAESAIPLTEEQTALFRRLRVQKNLPF